MPRHPFTTNDHHAIIKEIARDMKKAGFLNTYLELGISMGTCINEIAKIADKVYGHDYTTRRGFGVIEAVEVFLKHNKNWYLCGLTRGRFPSYCLAKKHD